LGYSAVAAVRYILIYIDHLTSFNFNCILTPTL